MTQKNLSYKNVAFQSFPTYFTTQTGNFQDLQIFLNYFKMIGASAFWKLFSMSNYIYRT